MHDPDADRRSRTLLGWIRRLFDKDWGSDWPWYDDVDRRDGAAPPYRPRSRS